MRKVVPLVVVVIVILVVVRSGLFKKSPTHTPTQPAKVTPTQPDHSSTSLPANSSVPRPSDPAVAAVMDEMLAAWDNVPAVFAAVETKIPEAAGHKGTTKGKGKYWLQKKDGTLLIHFDLRNELRIRTDDGTSLITGEELVTTIDGKYVYNFIAQPGHKEAVRKKLNYADVLQIAGPHLFIDLVSNNKLSLLSEEMKDNRATKVIRAQPNDGSRETINYFDKATGIRVEMTELDAQGQEALQIRLIEINTNPTISDEQFQFVVPAGVTLEDQSNTP